MLDSISDPGSWYTYMAVCYDFDENIYSFSLDGHVRHIINTVLVARDCTTLDLDAACGD